MSEESNNWFEFANEDFKMAEIAFREKIYNQACFHSQQAAEKFLKGYLLKKNKEIPKTHSLGDLLNLCVKIDQDFERLSDYCGKLDAYYIPMRYPDALPGTLPEGLPEEKDALEAISFVKEIKKVVMERL